jgi:nucleoside-diphosphate-sugar epimerase
MANNILVWGVGWLGLPLVKKLKETCNNICCITRSSEKIELLNKYSFQAVTVDEFIDNTIFLKDFDVFILTTPPVEDPSFFEMLSLILTFLPNDCQVIYTSSTGIYKNSDGLLNETSEIDVKSNAYQTEVFLSKKRNQNLTILRLGGLIGPKRHPVHFLAKKSVNTNPNQVVNLIQQIDVIRVIKLFIDIKKSGIYNVCSPEHPTRKEYYEFASREFELDKLIFDTDEHQSGKLISSNKLTELFPDFTFTSIYDIEKCK